MTRPVNCARKPRGSASAYSRTSGSSSDAYSWLGNAARTRVVLPDCRGPVRVTTGYCRATFFRVASRVRRIMQIELPMFNLQGVPRRGQAPHGGGYRYVTTSCGRLGAAEPPE